MKRGFLMTLQIQKCVEENNKALTGDSKVELQKPV
jgi:hypothetical protein